MQRLREGHGEGGAAWLRTELEAKSTSDLRQLCAMLGLPQKRDGRNLRKEQLLESIVESLSSQEGWSQGMGVVYSVAWCTSCVCCSRRRLDSIVESYSLLERVVFGDGCLLLVSKQNP